MWRHITVFLITLPAYPAIDNIRVLGTTATQAVLAYSAPSAAACSLQISERNSFGADYSPVHDVNSALFPGADSDARTGSVVHGRSRTFVAGKRAAERAADGRYYSRALQAFTTHYFQIACGTETGSGSFTTSNIPLGYNYNEPLPLDPGIPGRYAWPTIVQWRPAVTSTGGLIQSNTATAITLTNSAHGLSVGDFIRLTTGPQKGEEVRVDAVSGSNLTLNRAFTADQVSGTGWAQRTPEKGNPPGVIDPQTGLYVRPVTAPGQNVTSIPVSLAPACDENGTCPAPGWTGSTLTNLAAAGGGQTSFTGTGAGPQPALFVAASFPSKFTSSTAEDSHALDFFTPVLRGSGNGSNAADNSVDVCVTLDRTTCRTRSITVDLSACASKNCYAGNSEPVLAAWQGESDPIGNLFSRMEVAPRSGQGSWNAFTMTLTRTSGDYFSENWAAGSRIRYSGAERVIAAVLNGKQLQLEECSGCAASGAFDALNHAGILIRKTTATANTVNLDLVGFNAGISIAGSAGAANLGSGSIASYPQTWNGRVRDGYLFVVNGFRLYWIDRDTADATQIATAHGNGPTWGNIFYRLDYSTPYFPAAQPGILYGSAPGSHTGGGTSLLKLTYSGAALDRTANTDRPTLLGQTSELSGEDLTADQAIEQKLAAFTAGRTPAFDPYYFACDSAGLWRSTHQIVKCYARGGQDTLGWVAVLDVATKRVAGAMASYGAYPLRMCASHGAGSLDGVSLGGVRLAGGACGTGPIQTELAEAVSGTPGACPDGSNTSAWGRSGKGCSTIRVAGDLHDPNPCATLCNGKPCENDVRGAGSFLGAAMSAKPGDLFLVGSEKVQLLSKDAACADPNAACTWTVLRGLDDSQAAPQAAGAAITAGCFTPVSSGTDYTASVQWDFLNDPYGENARLDTVRFNDIRHGAFSPSSGVYVHWAWDGECKLASCYKVRTGNMAEFESKFLGRKPDHVLRHVPPFAGKVGAPASTDAHLNLAPGGKWFTDQRPELSSGVTQNWTRITGSSQLYSTSFALNRKHLATEGHCGTYPLRDASPGPIADGQAGLYTFCAGASCVAGAAADTIVANCPRVTHTVCSSDMYEAGQGPVKDLCVHDVSAAAHNAVQVFTGSQDLFGLRARRLGSMFGRYKIQDVFARVRIMQNEKWLFGRGFWLDGVRTELLAVKLPPPPAEDGVNRTTFIPLPLKLGSAPAGTDTAVVEFGYEPEFRCTSSREVCLATAATVGEAAPFAFESENPAGAPCTSGCTITIPQLPQRVLYYRVKYRAAGGTVIATGATQVAVSP
ncbi:MAG TPA: hypothetical protein VN428_13320 [Bryobacteraceae bacterium]|nr:hypothetical protein [Bryobacteraceae bacterium]